MTEMRMILAVFAALYSAAVFAQADKPPTVGDEPLVQVKPKATKATRKPEAAALKGTPQSTSLQACLDVNDGTKDRRNCYDAVIPPAPKPKAPKVKGVADCRFFKEEDERLLQWLCGKPFKTAENLKFRPVTSAPPP